MDAKRRKVLFNIQTSKRKKDMFPDLSLYTVSKMCIITHPMQGVRKIDKLLTTCDLKLSGIFHILILVLCRIIQESNYFIHKTLHFKYKDQCSLRPEDPCNSRVPQSCQLSQEIIGFYYRFQVLVSSSKLSKIKMPLLSQHVAYIDNYL